MCWNSGLLCIECAKHGMQSNKLYTIIPYTNFADITQRSILWYGTKVSCHIFSLYFHHPQPCQHLVWQCLSLPNFQYPILPPLRHTLPCPTTLKSVFGMHNFIFIDACHVVTFRACCRLCNWLLSQGYSLLHMYVTSSIRSYCQTCGQICNSLSHW